jgi:hypothetical protein
LILVLLTTDFNHDRLQKYLTCIHFEGHAHIDACVVTATVGWEGAVTVSHRFNNENHESEEARKAKATGGMGANAESSLKSGEVDIKLLSV